MGKVVVRLTVFLTCIYMLVCFYCAQFYGIDILYDCFVPFFELCVVIYTFGEGRYHCRYMKFSALALFVSDTLTRLDNAFDFLTVNQHNYIPIAILALGLGTTTFKALLHFYKISKLRNKLANNGGN